MPFPHDYAERVYAGVLGKMIGVYLGRPFEGMWYRDVLKNLGEINYYVHERRGRPLIVTDDDLSGTFTFIRALEDYATAGRNLSAEQIGQAWLNYIIENKAILWWGGMGLSTEHTAFLRLKNGIPAPHSGSMQLNSKVVAEQIGAQIFIDGWAMVSPGQPDLAANFAKKAASVSHDGEAIYGAQVIAAMEAQAFVESDLHQLLDVGISFIPKESVIYRMIGDLRNFREKNADWNAAMTDVLEKHYGYDKFAGNCHMVPNHGIIILALLYGGDDFQKSLMIANTCGWDTDCNSGNVGCLLGIKNGLAGIDAGPDWRGPVADRLFLTTADGGDFATDAVTQAYRLVNMGRALSGEKPVALKNSARFHFTLPGSVQGFTSEEQFETRGSSEVSNIDGSLAISYKRLATGRPARVSTTTFIPPDMLNAGWYGVLASPTLFAGQTVSTSISANGANTAPATAKLFLRHYVDKDELVRVYGPEALVSAGQSKELSWKIPDVDGQPIQAIGFEIAAERGASGTVLVHYLSWSGAPDVTLGKPTTGGENWKRAWVQGVDAFHAHDYTNAKKQAFVIIQNRGRGLAIQGTRQWTDYTVAATITPHLAAAAGVAARVQGMRRYYALLLVHPNQARLVKVLHDETVLAEREFNWQLNDDPHALELTVRGNRIIAAIDGKAMFDVTDTHEPLTGGAIGIVMEDGRLCVGPVRVRPA